MVITIIVLLILAGVSISLVVGDNGVLTQSKNSSDNTKIGQMQEALQIAMSDTQTAYFGNYALNASVTFDDMVNAGTLYTALKSQGYELLDASKASCENSTSEFTTSFVDYYISDGTNAIKVKIKKPSTNSTALTIEYENPVEWYTVNN